MNIVVLIGQQMKGNQRLLVTVTSDSLSRLTVTDTDIWFKTREMQQTDLGKQMKQLQTDIKQMSRWLVVVADFRISLTMIITIINTNN